MRGGEQLAVLCLGNAEVQRKAMPRGDWAQVMGAAGWMRLRGVNGRVMVMFGSRRLRAALGRAEFAAEGAFTSALWRSFCETSWLCGEDTRQRYV